MKKHSIQAIRIGAILLHAFSVLASPKSPTAYWSFDADTTNEITGHASPVPGVLGSALKFDGFTTRVTTSADASMDLARGFSAEAWIAPQEYSWNWTGIIDQERGHRMGFSFGINDVGQVGLAIAVSGTWHVLLSTNSIPLLKWSHVVATYDPSRGMAVYVDGQLAGENGVTGLEDVKERIWIGMSHTKQWPTGTERAVSKTPSTMVFDGLLDEVKLYNTALEPQAVLAAFQAIEPENKQPLQFRKMPSGPDGPGAFGAYYTHLKYSEEWDRLWRVSDHPDIVVRFDESPTKVVFWRGTGYCPAWVSENDRWVSDQGPEIYHGGCYEHMSDKQCRFSHVRILESTPARVLVHWRTALPNVKYQSTDVDPQTGWEPWGDDYYYIYPDGVCVRYQRAWSSKIHEFMQSEVLCQPGTKPQDNIELDGITVMDLEGNTNTFSWEKAYGERLPTEKVVNGPIQIINLKSKNRHYVIGETGAHFKPFTFGARKGYSTMPNWNHWPVAQLPNDGRVSPAPDRPSATCLGTLYPKKHKGEGVQQWVCNLYGMTDNDPAQLAVLGRSWNTPPELELQGGAFSNEGYDKSQRAYELSHLGINKPKSLHCMIKASEESPVVNLAILVKNWGDHAAFLTLNDQSVEEGKDFRVGYRHRLEGVDLIVWIKIESQQPLQVSLEAR